MQSKIRLLIISFLSVIFTTLIVPTNAFASVPNRYSAETKTNETPKVLLVSLPRVTWKHLEDTKVPNIDSLIRTGSTASLSIRTPGKSRTLEKGYASISAGNRALVPSSSKTTFYDPSETVNHFLASDTFEDQTGLDASNASAVALGFERVRLLTKQGLYQSDIGAFASSLQANNHSVGVYGNADFCYEMVSQCSQRSIGYLGTNSNGIIEKGDVSRRLLDSNLMLDMEKIKKAATTSLKHNTVTAVECSNLERADFARKYSKLGIGSQRFRDSLAECDGLIGDLVSNLDLSKDRIYIVSPVSPRTKEQLTVFISAGAGIMPGYSISGLTRHRGIVALGDIAPSILSFLEIKPPDSMVSTLMDWKKSTDSVAEKKSTLVRTNDRARIRDTSFNLVATIFVLIVFLSFVLSVITIKKIPKLRQLIKFLLLLSMMMPMVTFLMSPFMTYFLNPAIVGIAFVGISSAFAFLGFVLGEKFGYVFVILSFASVNLLIQFGDILTGGNLQLNSLFGYSAIVAGRFAGFGNLTFSILAICAILVVAMLKELSLTRPWLSSRNANIVILLFLIAVLIIDGAPYLGSDIGGVLALTPTICIIAFMLFEKRLTVKAFGISAAATLVTISVFSLFDLTRPVSERTHLGRFVETIFNGGAGPVIERKIISNFNILTNSVIASVVIITTLFFMFLFFYPERFVKASSKHHPAFKYVAYPGLVAGTLGMLLNDSGVAIPGVMMTIAFPATMLLIADLTTKSQSDTTSVR